jgi:hypothetical protein
MEMVEGWKDEGVLLDDPPIGRLHMGDDPRLVFGDMAVAVDNSGIESARHWIGVR